jgi:hypothetical protein
VYGIFQLEDVSRVKYVSWEMCTKDVYSKICQLEMCSEHNMRCVLITIFQLGDVYRAQYVCQLG